MKLINRIICIIILIFSFQSWTKADDIRDFEIEGMSLGDSLLDYLEIQEINKKKSFHYPNKKFGAVTYVNNSFKIYNYSSPHFKKNDDQYIIQYTNGVIEYKEDISSCYNKKNEIVEEISKLFTENVKMIDRGKYNHPSKDLGKTTINSIEFHFVSGDKIKVQCYDYDQKTNPKWSDILVVAIASKEYEEWLASQAYIIKP